MAADASPASTAATEHSDAKPLLSEVLNQESGQAGVHDLRVLHARLVDYLYPWQGKQVEAQKVQVLFQSYRPEEYCLGVAKLQRKDKKELKQVLEKFAVNTTWKFTAVKLLDEKTAYIHTTCRITIDLRKSKSTAMLQSTKFPGTPCPTTTIADILTLKQMQRFDLMAIPVSILFERRSSGGQIIADVRLIDGSKDPRDKGDAPANATIPVTLWFKSNEELAAFKVHIGRTPLLFMCLTGNLGKDKKVNVATVKDQSWWEKASGTKCDMMKEQAGMKVHFSVRACSFSRLTSSSSPA